MTEWISELNDWLMIALDKWLFETNDYVEWRWLLDDGWMLNLLTNDYSNQLNSTITFDYLWTFGLTNDCFDIDWFDELLFWMLITLMMSEWWLFLHSTSLLRLPLLTTYLTLVLTNDWFEYLIVLTNDYLECWPLTTWLMITPTNYYFTITFDYFFNLRLWLMTYTVLWYGFMIWFSGMVLWYIVRIFTNRFPVGTLAYI